MFCRCLIFLRVKQECGFVKRFAICFLGTDRDRSFSELKHAWRGYTCRVVHPTLVRTRNVGRIGKCAKTNRCAWRKEDNVTTRTRRKNRNVYNMLNKTVINYGKFYFGVSFISKNVRRINSICVRFLCLKNSTSVACRGSVAFFILWNYEKDYGCYED